jgi:hypothetical protein
VAVGQTLCKSIAGTPEVFDLSVPDGYVVRGQARLSYAVPAVDAGRVVGLEIFNLAGRRIRLLVTGSIQPGKHEAVWDLRSDDGARIGAGVYFARLRVGNDELSRKLVVLAE